MTIRATELLVRYIALLFIPLLITFSVLGQNVTATQIHSYTCPIRFSGTTDGKAKITLDIDKGYLFVDTDDWEGDFSDPEDRMFYGTLHHEGSASPVAITGSQDTQGNITIQGSVGDFSLQLTGNAYTGEWKDHSNRKHKVTLQANSIISTAVNDEPVPYTLHDYYDRYTKSFIKEIEILNRRLPVIDVDPQSCMGYEFEVVWPFVESMEVNGVKLTEVTWRAEFKAYGRLTESEAHLLHPSGMTLSYSTGGDRSGMFDYRLTDCGFELHESTVIRECIDEESTEDDTGYHISQTSVIETYTVTKDGFQQLSMQSRKRSISGKVDDEKWKPIDDVEWSIIPP